MRQRSRDLILLLTGVLAFCCATTAQTGQPQSDQPAGSDRPARQGRRGSRGPSPTANLTFDAHDFSGVWMGRGPFNTLSSTPPPMTAWAQARYDAAKPGIGRRAQPLGNDPIMGCDPIGYPRIAFYNAYPMEFVQTKDQA